jgi:hypothetical protein
VCETQESKIKMMIINFSLRPKNIINKFRVTLVPAYKSLFQKQSVVDSCLVESYVSDKTLPVQVPSVLFVMLVNAVHVRD